MRTFNFSPGWSTTATPETDLAFTLTNNQSSAANVTGLSFDPNLYRSVHLRYDIYRKTDTASTECRETGLLTLIYSVEESAWTIRREGEPVGNDTGVVLTVSGNQVQYTTTNISGANGVHLFSWQFIKGFAKAA